MATKVFNLIILDESGSMSCVTKQTIDGCNETINVIKAVQRKHADTQNNVVSIFAFQDGGAPSRYIVKNVPAEACQHITASDYEPWGATPLYDAVGATLTELKHQADKEKDCTGSITIITDGEENASTHFSLADIVKLIEYFKELGWNINLIGANIDVLKAAKSLNIDNHLQFDQTAQGTGAMFQKYAHSRMAYADAFTDADIACPSGASPEERREVRRKASKGFFKR